MSYPHAHQYVLEDRRVLENSKRSSWVLALTTGMMVVEIIAGILTHSMALLADGWHMASHAGAMLIALIAYQLGRSEKISRRLSFGAGKFIPLGGYTSALILALIAILMAVESTQRFFSPETIRFNEAIWIAGIGLVVNLLSAWILGDHDHEHHSGKEDDHDHHHHHDHNLRSAYVHVLADALTSVLAIVALLFGKYFGWNWMDPVMGIVGAGVILRWAYNLCMATGAELLDVHSREVSEKEVRQELKSENVEILDLHLWRIAPNAVACELVVKTETPRGGDHYRRMLKSYELIKHMVVEEVSA